MFLRSTICCTLKCIHYTAMSQALFTFVIKEYHTIFVIRTLKIPILRPKINKLSSFFCGVNSKIRNLFPLVVMEVIKKSLVALYWTCPWCNPSLTQLLTGTSCPMTQKKKRMNGWMDAKYLFS